MSQDHTQELLPCPFCGGTEIEIVENGRVLTGTKYGEPSSVSVRHHCPPALGQPNCLLERVGRDRASAIAAWNMRAAAQPGNAITDEQIDGIAESLLKAMPDGLSGFMKGWGWRQFARELLDVCSGHCRAAAQPFDAAPATRTAADFAIEHAGYMARAARALIDAVDAYGAAMGRWDEDPSDQAMATLDSMAQALVDAQGKLRNMIYEFEKRRDRAAQYGGQEVREINAMREELEEMKERPTYAQQFNAMKHRSEAAEEAPANLRKAAIPLTPEQFDLIANDGMRNAAGGIYASSVHRFAEACVAEFCRVNGIALAAQEPVHG